jgi:hypothetical protein
LFETFQWNKDVDMADGGGVITNGFEDAHFGDALAMQSRKQGMLQKTVYPGFLLAGPELVDPDGIELLFAGKGVEGDCGGGWGGGGNKVEGEQDSEEQLFHK